jgi:Ca-activated chloride channel family protein
MSGRCLLLVVLLLTCGISAGQGQERPVFSADSELVVLHVTVKDRRGAFVAGLPPQAFGVIEDGRAQTVRVFTDTDTPATVGLLVDSSASMHANRALIIAGATAFAEASQPGDEFFALTFNEDVHAVLPPAAPFTGDSRVLRAALERGIAARGQTALYDAISAGLDYLERGSRERKVLILVSDGSDNASRRATRERVIRKAQASNAVIYTVAVVDHVGSRDGNPSLLRELAQTSGGEAYRPREPRMIADVLREIARSIRHTYTVGYVSTNTAHDGAFRGVRVVVTAPPGRPLVARTRAGYLAGTQPVTP